MPKLTKEQWQAIERELSMPWGRVVMNVDGYTVTWRVARATALKSVVHGYINNEFRGAWMIDECPERKILCRPVEKYIHKPKTRQEAIRDYGKRFAEKYGINKKFTQYNPLFPSIVALRRHLSKVAQSIELVACGGPLEVPA